MLELREVSARYGSITALHGISLVVNQGEIVTLIGATVNNAGQIVSGDAEPTVGGRTSGQHHRVIHCVEFFNANVAPDGDIADEADILTQIDSLIAFMDGLDRLMVGRHAKADEAIRHRQPVDNIDAHILAKLLLGGFRRVIAAGPDPTTAI